LVFYPAKNRLITEERKGVDAGEEPPLVIGLPDLLGERIFLGSDIFPRISRTRK